MVVANKAELIAEQLLGANVNKKQWGSIGYNAIVEDVIEGGVTDTTAELQALVNKAISEGRRTIFLPHVTNGEYRVTALTNADQVDFVGDNSSFVGGYTGTIGDLGGFAALEAETVTGIFNVVTGYGATGLGVADDTSAIQAAINAAEAAGGGIVYFPPGTYLYTNLFINGSNILLQGSGASSILKQTIATGSGIEAYNATGGSQRDLWFSDLYFDSSVTKTSGAAIYTLDFVRIKIERCTFNNQFDGVNLNLTGASFIDGCYFMNIRGTGFTWNAGDDVFVSNTIFTNLGTIHPNSKGIYWRRGGGLFLDNVDVVNFDYGLYIKPEVGETTAWGFFTNFLVDTGGAAGIYADGSLGKVYAIHSTNCWSSSNTGEGIRLINVDGYSMNNDRIVQNHSHGMYVNVNCKDVNIQSSHFMANNTDNIANGSGVFLEPNASNFMIQGCVFENDFVGFGVFNQKYGIYIESGSSSRFSILGNTFRANQIAPIRQLSVGNEIIIKDNISDESKTIASASTITFPETGELFTITGTTNINNAGVSRAGRRIVLLFTAALVVTRGFNIKLNGSDFIAANNATLELISDGSFWQELGRNSNS